MSNIFYTADGKKFNLISLTNFIIWKYSKTSGTDAVFQSFLNPITSVFGFNLPIPVHLKKIIVN